MSLGKPGQSPAIEKAVNEATKRGIAVVAAAGNFNDDACTFAPAFAANTITVGATDRRDKIWQYSNYGKCVDIFAPGNIVRSAHVLSDSAYKYSSGTSMACPHVS